MSFVNNVDTSALFKEMKYSKHAKNVRIQSVKDAVDSVEVLKAKFKKGNKETKLEIAKVMQYSANRLLSDATNNKRINNSTKKRLISVGTVYKNEVSDLWDAYRKIK